MKARAFKYSDKKKSVKRGKFVNKLSIKIKLSSNERENVPQVSFLGL